MLTTSSHWEPRKQFWLSTVFKRSVSCATGKVCLSNLSLALCTCVLMLSVHCIQEMWAVFTEKVCLSNLCCTDFAHVYSCSLCTVRYLRRFVCVIYPAQTLPSIVCFLPCNANRRMCSHTIRKQCSLERFVCSIFAPLSTLVCHMPCVLMLYAQGSDHYLLTQPALLRFCK